MKKLIARLLKLEKQAVLSKWVADKDGDRVSSKIHKSNIKSYRELLELANEENEHEE